MKYFVILSTGAYSDYSPTYYIGDEEITEKEFKDKGRELGDYLLNKYNELPEREHKKVADWDDQKIERYNPETGKTIMRPSNDEWFILMDEWLTVQKEYKTLPNNIPEINCYYDFPNSNREEI